MGNKHPSEYNGENCIECGRYLPPCKDFDDFTKEWIDRIVRRDFCYVYNGGQYYRIVGGHGYYCPEDWWKPKTDYVKQQEQKRREERERQLQEQAAREREAARLREVARQQEQERLRQEEQRRQEEEQQRQEQARIEAERLEALRLEQERAREERTAREEEQRVGAIFASDGGADQQRETQIVEVYKPFNGFESSRQDFNVVHKSGYDSNIMDGSAVESFYPEEIATVSKELVEDIKLAIDLLISEPEDKELSLWWLKGAQDLMLAYYMQSHVLSHAETDLLLDFLAVLQIDLTGRECLSLADTFSYLVDTNPSDFSERFRVDADLSLTASLSSFLLQSGKEVKNNNTWMRRCLQVLVVATTEDKKLQKLLSEASRKNWRDYDWFDLFEKSQSANISEPLQKHIVHLIQTYCVPPAAVMNILDTQPQNALSAITEAIENEGNQLLVDIFAEMRETELVDEELLTHVETLTNKIWNKLGELHIRLDYDQLFQSNLSSAKSVFIRLADLNATVTDDEIADSLFTLMCACLKVAPFYPRRTQMVSLVMLVLSTRNSQNYLLEVMTGEGKSLTVVLFSTILGVQGKHVDVVTSSPLLAVRDSEEWVEYFNLFGLTVTHNTDLERAADADASDYKKAGYQNDVVYGTASTFAGDILREEFKQEDIRGGRRFDAVIVDEVDMLMLDEGVQFTYLSHDAAILHHIEPVISSVWGVIGALRVTRTDDGQILYAGAPKLFTEAIFESLDPELSGVEAHSQIVATALEHEIITQEAFDNLLSEDQEVKKEAVSLLTIDNALALLASLEEYENMPEFEAFTVNSLGLLVPVTLVSSRDSAEKLLLLENGLACIVNSKYEIIDRGTEILKSRLVVESEGGTEEGIWVPSFISEYVTFEIPNYIDSAIRALHMEEDREYAITKGRIIPVDFQNSGVLELNKKWGGGLQQMLEMKHSLSLSAISLVTNFMSNVEFFSRYKREGGIYGMSGTLGLDSDSNTTKILNDLYDTKVCYIPTFKFRKLFEKPAIIVEDYEKWFHQIVQTVVEETTSDDPWNHGRAVLILCEDIKTAEDLKDYIIEVEKWDETKVFLYAHSNSKQINSITSKLGPGELIIATNLAGRGTNIKVTNEVNDSGGLLCLVTFLARNRRVELQAFGRTARGGKPGNCRCILNYSSMPAQYDGLGIQDIRKMRAEEESMRLERLIENDVREVQLREELFKVYCTYLQGINSRLVGRDDIKVVLNALNENWGQWLEMKNTDIESLNKDLLLQQLRDVTGTWNPTIPHSLTEPVTLPIANFYHFVQFGNQLMFKEDSDIERSYSYFTKSIEMEPACAAIGHYNRAYAAITVEKDDYKNIALADIKKAIECLNPYISEVSEIQQFTSLVRQVREFRKRATDDFEEDDIIPLGDLDTQIQTRFEIFQFLKQKMEEAVQKIEEIDDDIIAKPVGIFSLIPDADYTTSLELTRMWSLGMELVYSIEKKPRFCWEGLVVFLLGVAQIVGGVLLTVFTVGAAAQFGMGLIAEGISDCIAGIEGMITGEFSWTEWAIEKAIGLAISLISGGISRLASSGLKAIKAGYKIAKVGRQLKAIPKIIKNTVGSTMRKNLKTAAKYVTKEAIVQGVSYAQYHLMRLVIGELTKLIGEKITENSLSSTIERFESGYMGSIVNERYIKELGTSDSSRVEVSGMLKKRATSFFSNIGDKVVGQMVQSSELKERLTSAISSLSQEIGEESEKLKGIAALASAAIAISIVLETVGRLGFLVIAFPDQMDEVCETFMEEEEITMSSHDDEKYSYACASKLKVDLATNVADVFGKAVATLLEGQLNLILTGNEVNRKMSKLSRNVVGKYVLKTDRTMQEMKAMQNANYIRSVGADLSGEGYTSNVSMAKEYANHIKSSDAPGSILELRLAVEHYGQKVTIYQDRNGKLIKDSSIDPKVRKTDEEIKLVYIPPADPDAVGHYDVVIDNVRKRVLSEDSNCLYHAFAYGQDSSLSREDLSEAARRLRQTVVNDIEEMPQSFAEHIKLRQEMENLRRGNRFLMLGAGAPDPNTKILDGFFHQEVIDDKIYTSYEQANGVVCKAMQKFSKDITVVNGVVQETDFRMESFEVRMTGLNLNKAKGKRCWDTKPVVGMIKRFRGKGADSEVSFHLAPSRAGANAGDQYANAIPASTDYNNLERAIWSTALQNTLGANDFKMVIKGSCGPLNKTYQGAQPTTTQQDQALVNRYNLIKTTEPRAYQILDLNYEIEMPAGVTKKDLDNIETGTNNNRLTVGKYDNSATPNPSKITFGMPADDELFTPKDLSTSTLRTDGQLHNNELIKAFQKKKKLTVGDKPRYKVSPKWGGKTVQDQADFLTEFEDFMEEMEP